MHYIRLCYDKPGMIERRKALLDAHRTYFRGHAMPILAAGPLCASDTSDDDIGSFMLLEAASIKEVWALHEGDPYTIDGIFGEVRIDRLIKKIG